MLRFVPNHLKTKRTCKHAVKKLPFVIRYIYDGYKNQAIFDKTILENRGTLMFVPWFKKCVKKLLIIMLMQ